MTLLAKSLPVGFPQVTIERHSLDVDECSVLLFGALNNPTPLGLAWGRFFKLRHFNRFLLNLRVACLLHDLGKASERFQKVLVRQGTQIFRHEFLSCCFLLQPEMKAWLTQNPDVDYPAVLAAVAGHHLKAAKTGSRYILGEASDSVLGSTTIPRTAVYFAHEQVKNILAKIAEILSLPPAPDSAFQDHHWSEETLEKFKTRFGQLNHHFLKANPLKSADMTPAQCLLLALRAGVVVSDSLGSAMPRLDETYTSTRQWVQQFIADCFPDWTMDADWLDEKVIQRRIDAIETLSGKSFKIHGFQREAAEQPPRTLLLSGCGSGKTMAAWYWIQAQLKHHNARRVIFLYPTRATATEGFRDYVSWAGEAAALLHGTAAYDLDAMFPKVLEAEKNGPSKDYRYEVDYETDQRLFAMKAWSKQVISATTDSVLGFMANQYDAICMLPLLVDSILVVDEVHAYDAEMFKALQELLRHFDLPVLCMTASLPPRRAQMLTEQLELKRFPENPKDFDDLEKQMAYGRYRLQADISREEAETAVLEAFAAGQNVMWVLNQVDRCQNVARELAAQLPEDSVICYHSRFRLEDRRTIHESVIERFKDSTRQSGLILVTTQVCEMSLDLDADLLVSELAPIPALIQRMGRCCRSSDAQKLGRVGSVLITELLGEKSPEKPYEKEEIAAARDFLAHLLRKNTPVSQADMDDYLAESDDGKHVLARPWTAFVANGLYSPPGQFREEDDFTVSAILSSDKQNYLVAKKDSEKRQTECPGYIVPVPKHLLYQRIVTENPEFGAGLYEAPHTHYSKEFGFHKEEIANYEPAVTHVCF